MTSSQQISVTLTKELSETLERAVASGEFMSAEDVVRAALDEWSRRRTVDLLGPAVLRQIWDEGLASGPGTFAAMADIKREARRQSESPNSVAG